ncbi:DUF6807 domain-containing protein [Rhodopirellula sallentina]|uniref:Putative secreted protein n=1 Tax=Rhodopirellula sallentina SM41 TaxID=1263870 RepID=M5UIV5_9BACT|nr:PmoA family protein [Rhodopirellula sallentina]EMI57766.1 putative secreted protein [Rhodopirellula sallentina SM41]
MKPICTFLLILLTPCCCDAARPGSVIEDAKSISVQTDGTTLWKLNHDPVEGKPYFHPVRPPGGSVFTDLRPHDHPWHRGIWFSWKYINGVNYWEEDRDTGLSHGRTRLESSKRETASNGDVSIAQELEYAPGSDAKAVLHESRTIRISTVEDSGNYAIDWVSRFQALDQAITLGRTPIPGEVGGKSYGGYAGLSIRMSEPMRRGTFYNSHGDENEDCHGRPSPWVAFRNDSGQSLLFLDHPDNDPFPSKWYVAPGMPYFSPAVLFDEKRTIRANQTLTLKYRLVVCSGPISRDESETQWEKWVEEGDSASELKLEADNKTIVEPVRSLD